MEDYTPEYTPVEMHGGVLVKRDDLYCRAGIRGGKVRACWHLASRTEDRLGNPLLAAEGLITASARKSPQAQIVARIANRLGIPARCHMPQGAKTEEMEDMEAHGGTLVQHRAGYNNVIIRRATDDHRDRPGWRYIPFGMEHPDAMACTRAQVSSIVGHEFDRVVVCVGSGMSAAGILRGMRDHGLKQPVIGIRIGADPIKRLNAFAGFGWSQQLKVVDVTGDVPYHQAVDARLGDIVLDPHYEAKCMEWLQPGDLFWCVGIRHTAATQK